VGLPAGQVDQKRRDALALVDAIRAHLVAGVTPLRVAYRFAQTAGWRALL
jgi:hypothetical protein